MQLRVRRGEHVTHLLHGHAVREVGHTRPREGVVELDGGQRLRVELREEHLRRDGRDDDRAADDNDERAREYAILLVAAANGLIVRDAREGDHRVLRDPRRVYAVDELRWETRRRGETQRRGGMSAHALAYESHRCAALPLASNNPSTAACALRV
jgi:hypothetical protein